VNNVQFALEGAWKVMVAGLVLGAGLPLLFALGIRSLAYGAGGEAEVHESGVTAPTRHPIGTVLGWFCFIVVLLGVALGILYIVVTGRGDHLSFTHVFPTIVTK
jgi:hypothetical protein